MHDLMTNPYLPWLFMVFNGVIIGAIAHTALGSQSMLRASLLGAIGAVIGGTLARQGTLNLPLQLGLWGEQILFASIGALLLIVLIQAIFR